MAHILEFLKRKDQVIPLADVVENEFSDIIGNLYYLVLVSKIVNTKT